MLYLVLAIVGIIGLLYMYQYLGTAVECSGLKPACAENEYCGVDFVCHSFPDLYKETNLIQTESTYTLWKGLLFIIAALIFTFLMLRRNNDRKR